MRTACPPPSRSARGASLALALALGSSLVAAGCGQSSAPGGGAQNAGVAAAPGARLATSGAAAQPAPYSGPPARVVIVGGGLAGLVTAWELQKKGIVSHLLEATDVFGGRVATGYYGEGLFGEYGMQEMWADNPLLAVAREVGAALDEENEEPFSSILLDGKVRPYLQDTSDAYFASFLAEGEVKAFKAWQTRAQALRERAEAKGLADPEVKALQGLSFATWIKNEKLPHAVAELIRLTLECELASGWETFSALYGLHEYGIFLGGGQKNYHVKGGNVNLIKALAAAHKGPKTMSALVTRVDREQKADGSIVVKVHYSKEGRIHVVEAERVVLAVPFFRIHQIQIEPPLSGDKWGGLMSLFRGHYTVVHLILDKAARKLWAPGGESPFPVLADAPLGVIYGVMHDSPASEPTEVFSFLVHGTAAQLFHMVPRDTKIRELVAAFDKLWPGVAQHVKGSYVYTYHPGAIAVWPPGRSPFDDLSQKLREPELGLYLAGDWLESGHSDGAAKSAIRVAGQLAAELGAGAAPAAAAPAATAK